MRLRNGPIALSLTAAGRQALSCNTSDVAREFDDGKADDVLGSNAFDKHVGRKWAQTVEGGGRRD